MAAIISSVSEQMPLRERITTVRAWSDVAHNFRGDRRMLWKEIRLGFLLAGFVAQLGNGFFPGLFIRHAPAPRPTLAPNVVGLVISAALFGLTARRGETATRAILGARRAAGHARAAQAHR